MAGDDKYFGAFPTRLRGLIESRKTTITALANILKISRQSVSQYQDGTGQPNVDKLCKIAKHFNVSTDYLVGLSDVESANTTVRNICEETGLSEKAVEAILSVKKEGATDGVLSVFSSLVSDIRFWYALKDIRDAKDSYMSKEPMSDTVQMVKRAIEVENKYREHPGDTIISPKERCEMKLYHASQKFSNCAERIVKSND